MARSAKSAAQERPLVVKLDGVTKRFVIRKEKSLKERIVNFGRSNAHKDDFHALSDIDIEIPLGQTVGLVGHNGSGKSTLLKTVGGIIRPSVGTIARRGRIAALIELGAGFHPDLTGRENIYMNGSILGLTRREVEERFDEIVEFSGISEFIDTQVKFYSSGMYVRLAFAIAVNIDPDILLVDEVLAVGDEEFQRKCMDRMRRFQEDGCTIVLVSHVAEQIREMCDRVIVLDHGKIVFDGDPEPALAELSRRQRKAL
jgi:ABC-2 type transport system ATP-binding protein